MLKIRRPLGRLIFNMGIAIPGKTVFLIETAPRCFLSNRHPLALSRGKTRMLKTIIVFELECNNRQHSTAHIFVAQYQNPSLFPHTSLVRVALQRHHNERDGVSNHRCLNCLQLHWQRQWYNTIHFHVIFYRKHCDSNNANTWPSLLIICATFRAEQVP